MPAEVSGSETKTRYLVRSLVEEAITSSQLEGASTTRKQAMEMFRAGKRPADRSEQMIFNNLRGMEFIQKHQGEPLTPDLVYAIHTEMMRGTADDSDSLGATDKNTRGGTCERRVKCHTQCGS